MKITVFGTGYVGIVTGTCLAELGNEVLCIDVDKNKIKNLKNGIIPIYEPGLEELVKRNLKEKRLNFSLDAKKGIKFGEIIFNAVGTPQSKNGSAELKYVKEVAKIFGKFVDSYKIFVNKSTVPVGTTTICKNIIKKELKSRNIQYEFDVVSNPEFLREGSAIKDTFTPDRIIIGTETKKARESMEKLYRPIIRAESPLINMDIKSAEITKYAANTFLATKISFINEIANFCEKAGGNVQEIAKGIGLDGRIGSRFLHAGIGYGGACFPKDVKALIKTGKDFKHEFKIIKSADEVNDTQKMVLFKKLKEKISNLANKKIAIWGLSFKPKTDDIREAPSLTIIKSLLNEGAIVQAFDPIAISNMKKVFPNITYADTAYETLEDADALLICTEWDEFRSINLEKLKKLMKTNLVIDGRNIYSKKSMLKLGLKYINIG